MWGRGGFERRGGCEHRKRTRKVLGRSENLTGYGTVVFTSKYIVLVMPLDEWRTIIVGVRKVEAIVKASPRVVEQRSRLEV